LNKVELFLSLRHVSQCRRHPKDDGEYECDQIGYPSFHDLLFNAVYEEERNPSQTAFTTTTVTGLHGYAIGETDQNKRIWLRVDSTKSMAEMESHSLLPC
jgi:hypothetical protein